MYVHRTNNGKRISQYTCSQYTKVPCGTLCKTQHRINEDVVLSLVSEMLKAIAEYAKYVLELKERAGDKYRTLERYRELMQRITPAIGHIKLVDLRPQHLNAFYKALGEEGVSRRADKAHTVVDLSAMLKKQGLSRAKAAEAAEVAATTITAACQGKRIELPTAQAIAQVLGQDVGKLFQVEKGNSSLSSKTILEHHRLIRTILAQAEREMLVPYNAASKATPPKATAKEVNYFQVEDVIRIREALECEPLKWKVITHLLLITGCRRGEVMGLRWSRVDFANSQIRIDTNLLYSPKRGIYEDTTKTSTVRFIKLPAETMNLLKQYRGWYLEQRLKNGDRWHDTDFLFVKDNGEPMIPDSITAWLRKFSMRHDLPHINPHAFRHLSWEEHEFAEEAQAIVGDTGLIANEPFDGSVYLFGPDGMPVYYKSLRGFGDDGESADSALKIGRASCRERV